MTTTTKFDIEALRRSIEARDTEAQLALFAHDAEVTCVDAKNPPSKPLRLSGHDEIRPWLADVYGRDMEHRVTQSVVNGDAGAYQIDCLYPNGQRVVCAALFTVRDGQIATLQGVQAWDE
jgi:ketosteroid isomerase-like protein